MATIRNYDQDHGSNSPDVDVDAEENQPARGDGSSINRVPVAVLDAISAFSVVDI